MVDCEICMENFPIDCFEFLPCSHKLCHFCYFKLKKFECPYCRLDIEIKSEEENDLDYEPPIQIKKKKKKKNNYSYQNSNEQFFINQSINNLNLRLNNNRRNRNINSNVTNLQEQRLDDEWIILRNINLN